MTEGLDALHTALIFQQLDIADAILERLRELWGELQPTVRDLKKLLTVRDSETRTTTIMLICRLRMLNDAVVALTCVFSTFLLHMQMGKRKTTRSCRGPAQDNQ